MSMGTNHRRLFERARAEDYVVRKCDIAVRKRTEPASRQLSARLLKLQDEERRKFARELHDGAGQLVASLIMNTEQLSQADELNSEQRQLVADNADMLRTLSQE